MLPSVVNLIQIRNAFVVAFSLGIFKENLAIANYGVQGRAQLMAHLGKKFGLGSARSFGFRGSQAECRCGCHMLPHFAFNLGLRGLYFRVVKCHHRHIERCGDQRNKSQTLHCRNGQIVLDWVTKYIKPAENCQVCCELDHDDPPERCRRSEIKESQERNCKHPWKCRRGHAAVEITAPENAEDQVLYRNQRKQVVGRACPQHEGENPERCNGSCQNGNLISWIRVEQIKRYGDYVSDERPQNMADEKYMRAVACVAVSRNSRRNEVIHQTFESGQYPRQPAFHGMTP